MSQRRVTGSGVCVHPWAYVERGEPATALEGERSGWGKLDGCERVETMIVTARGRIQGVIAEMVFGTEVA